MRTNYVVFLAVALILAGCGGGGMTAGPVSVTADTSAPYATASVGGPTITAEVEDFTLTNGKVMDVAAASGGKVAVLAEGGKAEGSVNLAPGTYLVSVTMFAPSPEEDAFGLALGSGSSHRLYPEEVGVFVKVDGGRHTQAAYGPCKIVFDFLEPNAQLDKIEFKKMP